MDEFYLYNQLRVLEDIAAQYTEGKKICPTIRSNAELISSHLYRVAVIGEFKRGKSSLINALIGASVLPTDVIPLTAAITRLTYGTERKIIVHYKDGTSEEKTLDQLIDYATKYDRQREITAEAVREIEVKYPSVLCKNHIEILDTPGLNDNESMSEVTLSVLGDIDAAIVVISATKPLSLTEQELIVDLIRQEGIRHLIFVVTFLDSLFDDEERDRMLSFIRGRLSKEVLSKARERLQEDPAYQEKAQNILSAPDIFGVSSRQAMQGFTNDDNALLKESRFPVFKEELLALLTAAQSADLPKKVESITNVVEKELPKWRDYEEKQLSEQETKAVRSLRVWRQYLDHSQEELTRLFREMDAALEKKGLSPTSGLESAGLERMLIKCFVKQLSSLTSQKNTHNDILNALRTGKQEAERELKKLEDSVNLWVGEAMALVHTGFAALRREAELPDDTLGAKLSEWRQRPLPVVSWTEEPIPTYATNLAGTDVMPSVKHAIHRTLIAYGNAVNKNISSWRAVLIRQNAEDRNTAGIIESLESCINSIQTRRTALEFNYRQHVDRVGEISASIESVPRKTVDER